MAIQVTERAVAPRVRANSAAPASPLITSSA